MTTYIILFNIQGRVGGREWWRVIKGGGSDGGGRERWAVIEGGGSNGGGRE